MTAHQYRPARHAGLVDPAESDVGILSLYGSLIALINASSQLWVITGNTAAATRPASSDNENSPV